MQILVALRFSQSEKRRATAFKKPGYWLRTDRIQQFESLDGVSFVRKLAYNKITKLESDIGKD